MRSGIFKSNWKSWFAVAVTVLCAIGTLVPYICGRGISLDSTSTVLTVAALLLITAYFFTPDKLEKVKRWLIPIGFGILSILQLVSPLLSLYNILMLNIWLPRIFTMLLLSIVYFAGTLLCTLGSLFDFKKLRLFRLGALLNIFALLAILVIDFIAVGGFEYYSKIPDGILILSLVAVSRYFSVILFYSGMLLLSTNKKPC